MYIIFKKSQHFLVFYATSRNFFVVSAFHVQKTPRFSPLPPGENAHAPLSLRSPNRKILQGAGASRDVN